MKNSKLDLENLEKKEMILKGLPKNCEKFINDLTKNCKIDNVRKKIASIIFSNRLPDFSNEISNNFWNIRNLKPKKPISTKKLIDLFESAYEFMKDFQLEFLSTIIELEKNKENRTELIYLNENFRSLFSDIIFFKIVNKKENIN